MEYKGYVAAISYDDVTDTLHGHIVNSGSYSIVTFAASDVEGLKREFEISIDEYLAGCRDTTALTPLSPTPATFASTWGQSCIIGLRSWRWKKK